MFSTICSLVGQNLLSDISTTLPHTLLHTPSFSKSLDTFCLNSQAVAWHVLSSFFPTGCYHGSFLPLPPFPNPFATKSCCFPLLVPFSACLPAFCLCLHILFTLFYTHTPTCVCVCLSLYSLVCVQPASQHTPICYSFRSQNRHTHCPTTLQTYLRSYLPSFRQFLVGQLVGLLVLGFAAVGQVIRSLYSLQHFAGFACHMRQHSPSFTLFVRLRGQGSGWTVAKTCACMTVHVPPAACYTEPFFPWVVCHVYSCSSLPCQLAPYPMQTPYAMYIPIVCPCVAQACVPAFSHAHIFPFHRPGSDREKEHVAGQSPRQDRQEDKKPQVAPAVGERDRQATGRNRQGRQGNNEACMAWHGARQAWRKQAKHWQQA